MRRPPHVRLLALSLALLSVLRGQAGRIDEPALSLPHALARRISPEFRDLDDRRRELEQELAQLPPTPRNERSARIGWKVFGYDENLPARQWVEIDFREPHPIDAVVLIAADPPAAEANEQGIGFPRRFRIEVDD